MNHLQGMLDLQTTSQQQDGLHVIYKNPELDLSFLILNPVHQPKNKKKLNKTFLDLFDNGAHKIVDQF